MAVSHVYNQTVADGTATSVVRPSDWNSAHNNYQTLSGNTLGASTMSGTNLIFQGGNNLTLSVNGASLVFSAGGATRSWYENIEPFAGTQSFQALGSSHYVAPFILGDFVSASYIRLPVSWGLTSTSLASSNPATSTTFSHCGTINAVVYSQGTGANSRSLQYITSGSAGWTWQVSLTVAGASNNWTISNNFTWPTEGGTSNSLVSSWASTLSTYNVSTTGLTNFTGFRFLDVPFAASLGPGNYWMALNCNTTTGGGKGIAMNFSHIAISQDNNAYANLNQATNNSLQHQIGVGSWSTNAFATTSSIALANISSVASQLRPYFQLVRQV